MTLSRRRVSQGSSFEESIGYSRAVAVGPWTFVSGTTGYDYSTMTVPPDVVSQMLVLIPMLLLYELGVFLSAFVVRRKSETGRA